ncbi:hypothetical protein R0K19_26340, partial [Bacillus sp. SIMBA_161]
ATVTGELRGEGFRVEKLHFQPIPKLYIAGNLYLPDDPVDAPTPAVLYVCGHSNRLDGDVSCGSKAAYQRFGAWFARHGLVCL